MNDGRGNSEQTHSFQSGAAATAPSRESPIMRVVAAPGALVGWASLVAEYVNWADYQSLALTVKFFSYFSTLSNILAALTLTAAVFQPASRRFWLTRAPAATGVALYVAITGLPFIAQLFWNLQGGNYGVDFRLHYVMPTIYLTFWLLFVPDGTLSPRNIVGWMIFPFFYAIYALVRGAFTGLYPLPFMDVGVHGYPRVFENTGLMFIALLMLSVILLAIDGTRRAR